MAWCRVLRFASSKKSIQRLLQNHRRWLQMQLLLEQARGLVLQQTKRLMLQRLRLFEYHVTHAHFSDGLQ